MAFSDHFPLIGCESHAVESLNLSRCLVDPLYPRPVRLAVFPAVVRELCTACRVVPAILVEGGVLRVCRRDRCRNSRR